MPLGREPLDAERNPAVGAYEKKGNPPLDVKVLGTRLRALSESESDLHRNQRILRKSEAGRQRWAMVVINWPFVISKIYFEIV